MNETSKAMIRRGMEDRKGTFPWRKIFEGSGIDVGCGDDKLSYPQCVGFDKANGDIGELDTYFVRDYFDYVHSSQSLEHLASPSIALQSWINVTRPGGHIIVTVPDWCLYEKMMWPSRFNADHKSTWSLWLKGSPAPRHMLVPDFLSQFGQVDVKRCKLIDTNYNYSLPTDIDQTRGNAEAFIEFVLQKHES